MSKRKPYRNFDSGRSRGESRRGVGVSTTEKLQGVRGEGGLRRKNKAVVDEQKGGRDHLYKRSRGGSSGLSKKQKD